MDTTPIFTLEGKTVALVGAAGGIGRPLAVGLAQQGAKVICLDRDVDGGMQATQAAGTSARFLELDVLNRGQIDDAVRDVGAIDALVFTTAMNVRKRVLDLTGPEFDRVVALNLRASFDLVQAFGGPMVDRGEGSIVGFSSIRAQTVEPGQGVYAATKAGLVQLLRTAAAEFGPAGVRVNAVAPGVVETPLTSQIRESPDWYEAYAAKSALGRWARPDELIGAVVYLVSDASSFVTGSVLTVDGGWTAIDGRFDPPN